MRAAVRATLVFLSTIAKEETLLQRSGKIRIEAVSVHVWFIRLAAHDPLESIKISSGSYSFEFIGCCEC
ncbi:hypothetical protein DYI37_18730 [Fulvimarina endophytica]|uniref:Uncharacterized protein n=1 Tax=Fulvimarina endophytica TaxID=2293836 RepID=A0A371WY54_9HYPH|nr:hypothetical protein DYI37_18730 [Fulvimarina endophytica]